MFAFFVSLVLWLGHHHLTELVKVHRAGAVLVQLLKDALHLLISERSQQLGDQAPQGLGGDEALALLVVDPEGILQLPLHGLHVRVLDEEGGAELAELPDLDLAGAVLVDLLQQVLELVLCRAEAHRPHDLAKIICGEEILLLCVKEVEADLARTNYF